ncbi:MAG: asparaginase [Rhodospirillales bacterium]|nr:asparaginase [Rhodospirillales bacterium]
MSANPVLVEVLRGDRVESLHRGAVAVAAADGRLVIGRGDFGRPVFPRSAVKPLQALPLIETGAADRFGLDARHIALACASHSGTSEHTGRVAEWLERLGLGPDALGCGAHVPIDAAAAHALIRAGEGPSALHNNCSGKHTGFLSAARHLGETTAGYIRRDHPAQRRVAATLAEMTGAADAPWAVDGCGIPTFALPLSAIAAGMARLADPAALAPARRGAVLRIRDAMSRHPVLVAGPGRFDTEVMTAAPQVLVKGGAEGVHAAILPARGLGVAVKIDDGAGRAAEVAMLAVLHGLGAFTPEQWAALEHRARPVIRNVAGLPVGCARPAP